MQAQQLDFQSPGEVSYFGKEVVNRVLFLREDNEFISNAVLHASTRFIFYEKGNPLVNKAAQTRRLVILTNGDDQLATVEGPTTPATAKGLLDSSAEWRAVLETWSEDNREQAPSSRDNKPSLLFMGLKDESVGVDFHKLKTFDFETYLDHQGRYFGIPYFAVDVSAVPALAQLVRQHIVAHSAVREEDLIFTYSRKHTMAFTAAELALFSHGSMFFDWLRRNRFCPGCGLKVIGIHAGGKLKCTNEETRGEGAERKYVCPVRSTRVLNVTFPRTDAVVITAITNTERTKILLSLNRRYAYSKMYSCTSGFMEPSETVEVATKREIWEETGVVCNDIRMVMTQPWPFPGNLMIGCIATVEFNGVNEVIHLGHDRELADARWFDIAFVKRLISGDNDTESNPEGILLPTDVSIAYNLIKQVVEGGAKL